MSITKRQRQEIDFLARCIGHFDPTEDEISEFVAVTTYGIKSAGVSVFSVSSNPLIRAKRLLDITVKMWTRDWYRLFADELREDTEIGHPYLEKIIATIEKTKYGAVAHR